MRWGVSSEVVLLVCLYNGVKYCVVTEVVSFLVYIGKNVIGYELQQRIRFTSPDNLLTYRKNFCLYSNFHSFYSGEYIPLSWYCCLCLRVDLTTYQADIRDNIWQFCPSASFNKVTSERQLKNHLIESIFRWKYCYCILMPFLNVFRLMIFKIKVALGEVNNQRIENSCFATILFFFPETLKFCLVVSMKFPFIKLRNKMNFNGSFSV